VLTALLLGFLVAFHRAEQVFDVVDEPLAVGEAAEEEGFAAVGTFGFALLDPGAETVLAGEFAAGGIHAGLLDFLETDVAQQEGQVLPVVRNLNFYINESVQIQT
jgi:hypothetical protein